MAWDEFEKIVKDIEKDLKIDRMNMDEKSLQIPSIKHFWIAKLYKIKILIVKYEKKKKEIIDELKCGMTHEIGLSKAGIHQNVNSDPRIIAINERLAEYKWIVD
jgi:hypothetical protein